EAGDESELYRVTAGYEHNGKPRCCRFCSMRGRSAAKGRDHCHLAVNQISRQSGQPIIVTLRPAVFDQHVLAFDEADFLQPFPKRGDKARRVVRRPATEKPDHRHRRLLPPRRERPRHRRAAEQGDERATFHVWMAPAWQETIWRAAQRSLAVMCPACWCSPGGLLALMGSANRVLIIRTGSMSR